MATRIKSKTKYFCNDKEKLKEFIKSEGFIFKNSTLENDEYFLDTNFDMIENDSCIRVRTVNNKEVILSFEGMVKNLSQIDIKDSRNVYLDISQKDNIIGFLSDMGYYKYVSMNIDTIENVGEFVDFDIYTDIEDKGVINNIFYDFEKKIESCVKEHVNLKYRDYTSNYLYKNFLKGETLNRILIELDKIFVNLDAYNIEDSIKNNLTILNLELIEKIEQIGINIEIVYSNSDEILVNTLKKILNKIGYSPNFINIKEIKEIAIKETLIIEKQKKIEFSEIAFMILLNRNKNKMY